MYKIAFISYFSLCTLLLLFISPDGRSQENAAGNPDVFGIRNHYGFIIPHASDLKEISQTRPWGIQLEWSKLMLSEKSWNNCNCYAQTGFSFNYFNYGNPEQLGNSYNLIYFAEPYLSYKRSLFYSFRTGLGLTYLDQVYDETSNPENTFYSQPLSFLLLLNLNANYRLDDNFIVSVTANFNHISNGGMNKPNRGMNFPTFGLGLSYIPKPQPLPDRPKTGTKKGNSDGYLRLFGTLPTVGSGGALDNERKLLLGISGGVLYHLTHLNALNVGVELVRDGSLKAKAENLGEDYDHHLAALMLGHNLVFGRFTFNQQLGYYLYKPFPSTDKDFYQRYELLYRINDRLQMGTSLKSHGHVAENWDIRLGILF